MYKFLSGEINFRDDNDNCTNKPHINNASLLLPTPPIAATLFLWIFSIFTGISLFGNFFVIYTTCRRNYRYLQKTCIISLACSDLLSTMSIFWINAIDFISQSMIWVSTIIFFFFWYILEKIEKWYAFSLLGTFYARLCQCARLLEFLSAQQLWFLLQWIDTEMW